MKNNQVMKKSLAFLLALVLLLVHSPLLALAEGEGQDPFAWEDEWEEEEEGLGFEDEDGELSEEEEIVFPDELLVGHPTVLKGDFFTEMFGNDTSDIDVRALIHGYNLVNWDQEQGTYVIDWGSARQGNASADVGRTYLLLCLNMPDIAEAYLEKYCMKTGTSKHYVQAWLPIVAAAQLDKGVEKERELLMKWIDVVDYD